MKNYRVVFIALPLILIGAKAAAIEPAPIQSTPAPFVPIEVAPLPSEISLEQATKQVITSHYASRVLSAKTEEIDGRKVHVIKTLTLDGRIQQQTIAADTGVLLDIDNN